MPLVLPFLLFPLSLKSANVWSALEEAGHLILTGATDTTADVLEHKFGEQVGEVARETIGVGMDAYHTVGNLRVLSPTRLAIGGVRLLHPLWLTLGQGKSAVAGYLGLDKNDTLRLPAEERRPLTVAEVEEADLRFSQLRIEYVTIPPRLFLLTLSSDPQETLLCRVPPSLHQSSLICLTSPPLIQSMSTRPISSQPLRNEPLRF